MLFLLNSIQSYSQENQGEFFQFLKFKIYQSDIDSGIPFVETCFSVKIEDDYKNCIETDFDGYAQFFIQSSRYYIDSASLRIRSFTSGKNIDKVDKFEIPLNKIQLLKEFHFGNNYIITLIDCKKLSKKEYKKYIRKYGMLPSRNPIKAIDVN
jgi:hypothetical protein